MNRHPPRPPQQQETKNLKAPLLPNARGYGSAQRSRLHIHTQLKSTATQSHAIKHKSATAHTESVIEKIKKKATECSGKIQGSFFRRDKILKHSLDIYLQAMWYHDTAILKDFLVVEGVFNAFKRRLGIELRDELVKEHQIAANFVFDFGSFITDAKETDGSNHYRRIVMHAEEKLAQIQKPILRGEFPLVEYLKLANSALTSGATARKCLFKGIIGSMNLLIRQGENGSRSFEFPKDLGEKYQKGVRELEEAMISEYLYQAVLLAGVHGAHRLSLRIIKQQPITAIVALKHPSLSAREYWHQDQTSLFRLATGLNPDCLYGSKELPAQDIVDTRRSAIVEVQADRPGRIERAVDTKLPTSRKTQFARSPSPVESDSGNFALVVYRNDADTKKLRVEFNKRWTLQLEEKPPEQVLRTIQGQRKCRYCYISTSFSRSHDKSFCWSSFSHAACLGCTHAGLVCDVVHESRAHGLSIKRLQNRELPELTFSHVWAFITRRLPSIELDIARNLRQTRSKCLHCILDLQRREVCSRQASLKEIETLADLRGMPKNTMVACETCENNRERGDETTSRCSIIWFNKQTNRLHIVELLWRREADSPNVIQAAIHKLPLYDNSEKTASEVRNQQHLVVASQNEVPRTRRAGGRQEITPANHASRLEVNNRRVSDPPRRLYRYSTLRERRRSASPPLNHTFPARRRLVQRSRSPITNRRITSLSDGTGVNGYPRQQRN